MSYEQGLSWHKRWLALDDYRLGLLDACCELQSRLERQGGWFELSDAARADAERTSGWSDLDNTLRLIHRRLRQWLRALPIEATDDLAVVVANLQVAERLLAVEEDPVVHGLISRAVRDLSRMRDRL